MCPSKKEVTCRQRSVSILHFQTVIPNIPACCLHVSCCYLLVYTYTCRMLSGHADCLRCCRWDLSFTEFWQQCVVLWAAVVNGCSHAPCAGDSHSAHPGGLSPGAAPAQQQRCCPWALRGSGAAWQRQGRVHLDCQGAQVRVNAALHALPA